MIIVSGTKRSGTSMWMQILKAAGYPVLGEAFPRDWGETIRDANSAGFYESPLRHGIFYATNPHPQTGLFLSPQDTRWVAVKVFARGLVKSDLAYVDKVIATMRPWREYKASLERLYAMEHENKLLKAERIGKSRAHVPALLHMPAELEWWIDNYSLLRDALIRRYPLHMVSYDSVLRNPDGVVREAIAWLAGTGDAELAVQVVKEKLRTQGSSAAPEVQSTLSPDHEALFDELYERVDQRLGLDEAFIDRLNDAHDSLAPRIGEAERVARAERRKAREQAARVAAESKEEAPDGAR